MLAPHVKRSEDFFTVSGDEFLFDQYLREEYQPRPRRDRVPYDPDERCDEPKERLIHGLSHEQNKKKKYPHCNPPFPRTPAEESDIGWIKSRHGKKYDIKVEPIVSDDGSYMPINAKVTHNGRPCENGRLLFYIYEEE